MAKKIQDGNQIVTNVDSNDNLTFSIKDSFIDSTPTTNSTNLVTSGGVKSALDINTTDIAAAIVRIANNETNISNHTSAIQTLNGSVSTNTTDINTLKTTTGNLSTNVNTNTTNIGTLNNLTTTNKTNLVNAINELETDKLETSAVVNEASTDTDKPYSADYLNDKLVSVGTTAPTDGRRVWFAKGKNLFNKNTTNILNAKMSNNTIMSDNNERMVFIECKPNTTYTLSKTISNPIRNSIGTTQTLPTIGVAIDNAVYSATSPKTITTNANAKYIVWLVYSTNDTTNTLQQMLDSMQIEERK